MAVILEVNYVGTFARKLITTDIRATARLRKGSAQGGSLA